MNMKRSIAGGFIVLICVGMLFSWEKWGKYRFLYGEIIVLKENIEKGTIISKDMLEVRSWPDGDDKRLKIGQDEKIIGKVAAGRIHCEIPLYEDSFLENDMVADKSKNRYVLSIPKDWIESCSKILKVRDMAYFYYQGNFITRVMVIGEIDQDGQFDVLASHEQIIDISTIAQKKGRFIITLDGGE